MSRTMAYRRCQAHVVVFHTHEPPTDAEWEAYMRDAERWLDEVVGYLVSATAAARTGPSGA